MEPDEKRGSRGEARVQAKRDKEAKGGENETRITQSKSDDEECEIQ